jgi:hypothetical protein
MKVCTSVNRIKTIKTGEQVLQGCRHNVLCNVDTVKGKVTEWILLCLYRAH